MTEPGTEAIQRARQLALAQGTPDEIAAGLFVEYGWPLPTCQRFVAEHAEELQTMRFAGRMIARERMWRLLNGEEMGKHSNMHIVASETWWRGYLGIGDRDELRKRVEAAEKALAQKLRSTRLAVVG